MSTPEPVPKEVLSYAEMVVEALTVSSARWLVGAYLHGSAAMGGWLPTRSDVDLLVVLHDDAPAGVLLAVEHVLVDNATASPGTGLECSVVSEGEAANPSPPWPFLLHVQSSPGQDPKVVRGDALDGDRDLLMHYAVSRDTGVTVLGPDPAAVFGVVPRATVLDYLADELSWGLAHGTAAYAVLNACRALVYAGRGEIVSKVSGGQFALDQGLGPADVIARALDEQEGRTSPEPISEDATAFVQRVARGLLLTPLSDVTFRPITGLAELDLFCRLPYVLNDEVADDLAAGRRRPEWMWVALREDRLVARLAWWGRAGDSDPQLMDVFDIDDGIDQAEAVEVGAQLVRAATSHVVPSGTNPPDYMRFLGADWHDEPTERRLVENRMAAVASTGATLFVERLRLEWRADASVPSPGERLRFRPTSGRNELVELMTDVLTDTLDAHSRDDLTRMSASQAAAEQYDDEFASYASPRDWWRIATLISGEPVGFVIPARNDYNAIIAYIGVLPGHRGNGYINDILAEGTRILAEQDVPRIRAATDLANVPMARAFARAGYVNFERQINMRWPREGLSA